MARGGTPLLLLLLVALLLSLTTLARAQPPRRRFGGGPRLPALPRGIRSPPRRRSAGSDEAATAAAVAPVAPVAAFDESSNAAAAAAAAASAPAPATMALPPVDGAERQEPPSTGAQGSFCAPSPSSPSSPTLTSPDPVVGGGFGAAAALDNEGRVLLVGAPGEGIDPSLASAAPQGGYAPAGAGGAYYSTREGPCRWSAPRFLAPPAQQQGDASSSSSSSSSSSQLGPVAFGSAVAASGDGSTLLVGATLLRRPDSSEAGGGYVRPVVVYVADAATGDVVRQEVGEGEGADALLAQRDAGALAAAVLAGGARSALAHGAAVAVAVDAAVVGGAVFSDLASVFVAGGSGGGGGGGSFGRAGEGLPLELPASLAGGVPLQLTAGLRLSLSGGGRAAAASLAALYAPSTARGTRLDAAAPLVGVVQVFSRAGAGFALQQRVEPPASVVSASSLWGAAHALSDDGRALAVLAVAPPQGGGRDAVFVFRRADASAPFENDGEKLELAPGEQASSSVALSADGGALAVGLLSGRALLFAAQRGGAGPAWARRCAFEAGSGGAVEVRLPANYDDDGVLRLVAASAGAAARVFEVRSGPSASSPSCPSSPERELGGGSGGGASPASSSSSGLAVGGKYAVVGAPGASPDERLPASGGLFSFVLA